MLVLGLEHTVKFSRGGGLWAVLRVRVFEWGIVLAVNDYLNI